MDADRDVQHRQEGAAPPHEGADDGDHGQQVHVLGCGKQPSGVVERVAATTLCTQETVKHGGIRNSPYMTQGRDRGGAGVGENGVCKKIYWRSWCTDSDKTSQSFFRVYMSSFLFIWQHQLRSKQRRISCLETRVDTVVLSKHQTKQNMELLRRFGPPTPTALKPAPGFF